MTRVYRKYVFIIEREFETIVYKEITIVKKNYNPLVIQLRHIIWSVEVPNASGIN